MVEPITRQTASREAPLTARSGSRSVDAIITTKGNSSSPEHTDEISGRYTLSYVQLTDQIANLAGYRDVRVKDLTPELQHGIHQLKRTFSLLSTGDFYPRLIQLVKQYFGDMKTAKPGTVGAFFYGCFLPNNFGGQTHCSAECVGGIQPPEVKGWSGTCNSNVVFLEADGTMEFQHGTDDSTHAIIHVFAPRFDGMTHEQVEDLRAKGITRVDIDLVQADSRYAVVSTAIPLEEVRLIDVPTARSSRTANRDAKASATPKKPASENKEKRPRRSGRPHKNRPDNDHDDDHNSKGSSLNVGGIIIGVIFIILVIIILVILFQVFSSRGAAAATASNQTPDGVSTGAVDTNGNYNGSNNGGGLTDGLY